MLIGVSFHSKGECLANPQEVKRNGGCNVKIGFGITMRQKPGSVGVISTHTTPILHTLGL